MRGACAVVCALVAVCAATGLDETTRVAKEKQLLALLGMPRRPTRRTTPTPPVPRAIHLLYEDGAIPAAAANTARSYIGVPHLDEQFLGEHCFRLFFNVTGIHSDEIVRGADLTFHCRTGLTDKKRLFVYDIVRPGLRGKIKPILRFLDSILLRPVGGTVTADAQNAAKRWLMEPQHNHGLLVQVIDEGSNSLESRRRATEYEETVEVLQPLLLLYTEDERARTAREQGKTRNKRAAQRNGHRAQNNPKETKKATICQRRPLYVDFQEVGWSDWILAPVGYDAYFCQGNCPFPLTAELNATNHAIVQNLMHLVYPALVPKACCVPTELAAISVLYIDDEDNAVLKIFRNMVVVNCGCQ